MNTFKRSLLRFSVACFAAAFSMAAQSANDIRVMIYDGAYTSLPVHVANDKGFYENNRLNAELVKVSSGPAGVAALIGGSIDFAEPPTDQAILNVLNGFGMKVVVGNETQNFYKIMLRTTDDSVDIDVGYPDSIKQLKGKKIGVNALGSTTHLVMNAILSDVGLEPDDVTYIAVGSATTALAAWNAGQVDAQVAFTPFPEIVEEQGTGATILDLSKGEGPEVLVAMGGAFEGFITSDKFIENNRSVVDAFIQAHIEAIDWMKNPDNRDELINLVKQYVAVSVIPEEKRQEAIERMVDNYSAYLGYTVDPEAIPAWNEYLQSNKLATESVTPEQVIYEGAPKP